jgi:hypothetical protein
VGYSCFGQFSNEGVPGHHQGTPASCPLAGHRLSKHDTIKVIGGHFATTTLETNTCLKPELTKTLLNLPRY